MINVIGMTLKASCFLNRSATRGSTKKISAHSIARKLLCFADAVMTDSISYNLTSNIAPFIRSGNVT